MTLGAEDVVRDSRSPLILDHGVVVASEGFSPQTVVERARSLLKKLKPQPALFRLVVGTNVAETSRVFGHGAAEQNIYGRTIRELEAYGPPRGRIARVLATANGAVLSVRDESGFSERIAWGKRDPSQFSIGKATYRLVHFSLVDMGPYAKGRYNATFYFTKPRPLSLSSCADLLSSLQVLVGIDGITVAVRTIPWFPEDPSFPDRFLFQTDLSIPTRLEYLTMPNMSCSTASGRLNAGGNNIVP
jgi:hypothetical protein